MKKKLLSKYKTKKNAIKDRLKNFKRVWNGTEKRIFGELCFCICTPQSRAVICDKAVTSLEKKGFLLKGVFQDIRDTLKGVRFPNNKAKYILLARELFVKGSKINIKKEIDPKNITKTREWLASNIKGIGFKEASHFLRNIGLGENLAILDVHILRNMARLGLIDEVPKSLTKKKYMHLEDKLRTFSKEIKIPMDELDLLFLVQRDGRNI
ncbi:MAG: N-glycosylase/DNA lyase [Candidatus Omnitrophota bacterium]